MQRLKVVKAAALAACLAIVLAACGGDGGGTAPSGTGGAQGQGTKGGTLRVVNNSDVDFLDTADAYSTLGFSLERLYSRQLYSFDSTKTGEELTVPVPDLADGAAQVTNNNTTYTFKIRKGIKWAPPATGEVTAEDFVRGVKRMYDKATPSGGQSYSNLIKGAADFGSGKAKEISGIQATADTLTITLEKPAADFLSILAMPFFSPVPKEAEKYKVGADYSKHVIGSGPYTVKEYIPTKSMEFVRNTNWDPATDPLRKAWVDKVTMRIGLEPDAIQQTIERGDADLSLDTQPPNAALQRLSTDPKLKQQFSVQTTGCTRYFTLGTTPAFDTPQAKVSDVKVRQAINYALDKVALQRARGGPFAGDPASTVLTPTLLGYQKYDLYPSADFKGDVAKAKQLLTEAGFPNGITLNYVGGNAGKAAAVNTAVQAGLQRAGINLKTKLYSGFAVYTDSLGLPRKAKEHQIGQAGWCPDYPGDGARSFIVPLLDGRSIIPSGNSNYGLYNNPAVNTKIDQALAEPDKTKRGALWGEIDKQIMQDAPWAPFVYDKQQLFWSERTKNFIWTPWATEPDLTAIWLNPNTP
ncbi:MAG TPA: ABC transporter substrate-binding protein [Actinomycetes bacterium]|nr:ABC transporter substrate-binding protein [Actinomycetes bacterium]